MVAFAEHNSSNSGGAVITVGTYDGVHVGHQRLIREARLEAGKLGGPVVVVTFDRNPLEVVRPEFAPKLLADLELKLELLEATGIDEIVVLTFDQTRAGQSAEDFVQFELVEDLGAKVILVGSNFRFGYRQQGDVALLERLGKELGFVARGIDLVTDDETLAVVSSSRIRDLIGAGRLEEAAALLGRPHEVRGTPLNRWGQRVVEIPPMLVLPPAGRYEAVALAPGEPGSVSPVTVLNTPPKSPQLVEIQDVGDAEVHWSTATRLAIRFGR